MPGAKPPRIHCVPAAHGALGMMLLRLFFLFCFLCVRKKQMKNVGTLPVLTVKGTVQICNQTDGGGSLSRRPSVQNLRICSYFEDPVGPPPMSRNNIYKKNSLSYSEAPVYQSFIPIANVGPSARHRGKNRQLK